MTRAGRWVGEHLILLLAVLVLLYMFTPVFVVILMSFNDPASRNSYEFDGFTLDNWLNPCGPFQLCSSVATSLQIGLLATLLATALGTLMAFAMVRHRFRGRSRCLRRPTHARGHPAARPTTGGPRPAAATCKSRSCAPASSAG